MSVRSAFPETWTVGIDDTDMPGIGGTGRLARRIAAEIEALGLGRSLGVTRHQFYEGPGVPKTARNSAAAIVFDGVGNASELFESVCAIVARESIEGSDPGVAIGREASVELVAFARRAQTTLVMQQEARRLGATHAAGLAGLGGTDDGVIGALGAMSLRIDGNDGRYVDLPGIRRVGGVMTIAEVLELTGIVEVVDLLAEESPQSTGKLDLGDWVRPRLIGGRPVVVATRAGEMWVNADCRKK